MNVLKDECGISPAWDPRAGGSQPKFVAFQAIWDTGATNSVITQKVVDDCGLVGTGMTKVRGAHGVSQSETYLVNIVLPDNVVFSRIRVTKGTFTGGDILIGMDIINRGDFRVTNHNGITKFSYRIPSQGHIDFVEEIRKARAKPQTRAERRRAQRERKKSGR